MAVVHFYSSNILLKFTASAMAIAAFASIIASPVSASDKHSSYDFYSSAEWLILSCGALLARQELPIPPWLTDLIPLHVATLMSIFSIGFTSVIALMHILAQINARYKLHKPIRELTKYEGVSIIKPLVGADPNLESNLRTFFRINYPKFELLFCVHDDKDAAIPIVKKLMMEFPGIDAQLFCGREDVGLNPKINNMMPGYRHSKYPLIFLSDSSIHIREDTLTDLVGWMDDKTGLVTQLPFCEDRDQWGPSLEQVYFGTAHARIFLAADSFNFCIPVGMSQFIRKKALEECGGLERFGEFLSEDNVIGSELSKRGWKFAVAALAALQNDGSVTTEKFDARLCRWAKLRYALLPFLVVLEPMQDWLLNCALFSLSIWHIAGVNPLLVFAFHTLFWFSCDYNLFKVVHGGPMPMSLTRFLLLWLRREVSVYRVYLKAVCNPDITWRKGTYRWVDKRWQYFLDEPRS